MGGPRVPISNRLVTLMVLDLCQKDRKVTGLFIVVSELIIDVDCVVCLVSNFITLNISFFGTFHTHGSCFGFLGWVGCIIFVEIPFKRYVFLFKFLTFITDNENYV